MKLVQATLAIYSEAAGAAARGFARSAWAFGLLLILFPILVVAGMLLGPLGILGGFILAFINAACAGTYLATLQDALSVRRTLSFGLIRANLGRHTGDILSVLFPLWIFSLLVGMLPVPPLATTVVALIVALFFNPVPEMIGRARTRGMDLLGESMSFMGANWPEWIAPQLVVLGAAIALRPAEAVGILGLFGPHMGFVMAGSLATSGGTGPMGWAIGLGTVALVHLMMLFRGALYERLASGGRRARAWQQHFR